MVHTCFSFYLIITFTNFFLQVKLTCLEAAMLGGHYAVVELLLWNGADVSQTEMDSCLAIGDVNLTQEHELEQEEVVTATPFILYTDFYILLFMHRLIQVGKIAVSLRHAGTTPEHIRQLVDKTRQVHEYCS